MGGADVRLGLGLGFSAWRSAAFDGLVFTTTDTTQAWTIAAESGKSYYFDWGDDTGIDAYVGTGSGQSVVHNYAGPGTYKIKVWSDEIGSILYLSAVAQSLTGSIKLGTLSGCTNIYLQVNTVGFAEPISSLSAALNTLYAYSNYSDMVIGSLSHMTGLYNLRIGNNNLSGYEPSALSLLLKYFYAQNGGLAQSAVDQILSDVNDNLASRPVTGFVDLSGNTAPSAQGLIYKAAIQAHGWTVTTD